MYTSKEMTSRSRFRVTSKVKFHLKKYGKWLQNAKQRGRDALRYFNNSYLEYFGSYIIDGLETIKNWYPRLERKIQITSNKNRKLDLLQLFDHVI